MYEWQLVISALNDSATVSGRLGDYDQSTNARGVAREIATGLKQQQWQPLSGGINPLPR
ncbi:hypothetical protein SAMN06264365_1462 [Actinoplanes regularis]|uniref:Uncharacterized protein n=2 Tax=Actinoplanes regularis TaxID=52697 RepID=A0A239KA48_9ACTN|nr:hypothetical protein Are01nite_89600 [Actinoplanes regularis]SNT14840.1 hypothetical protein SAMN06264365_1462 [Actinoplanes regularis]